MSQEFQESLLKETPCVVPAQNKHENVFTNLVRKNSRRDLSKNDFSSVWSTNASHEASRKNVASAILMRRAPSIVFEDVGIVSDQLWSTGVNVIKHSTIERFYDPTSVAPKVVL